MRCSRLTLTDGTAHGNLPTHFHTNVGRKYLFLHSSDTLRGILEQLVDTEGAAVVVEFSSVELFIIINDEQHKK